MEAATKGCRGPRQNHCGTEGERLAAAEGKHLLEQGVERELVQGTESAAEKAQSKT